MVYNVYHQQFCNYELEFSGRKVYYSYLYNYCTCYIYHNEFSNYSEAERVHIYYYYVCH